MRGKKVFSVPVALLLIFFAVGQASAMKKVKRFRISDFGLKRFISRMNTESGRATGSSGSRETFDLGL